MDNNDGLERTLERLRTEQADDEVQLATLQQRVTSRQKAIEGLEGLVHLARAPEDAKPTWDKVEQAQFKQAAGSVEGQDQSRPGAVEAVVRVMTETGKPWTAKEMAVELARRGWAPKSSSPEDAVRTAMNRAWKAPGNGIARIGGSYAYRPELAKGTIHAYDSPKPDAE
jgi:hypothetical protein